MSQKLLAILGASALLALGNSAAGAYDPNYTKAQCDAYTFHGLGERYVFGGSIGWIDNDVWDASSTEGTDCSDFVARCLALPQYTAEHTNTGHPYGTVHLYPGIANTVRIDQASLSTWDFWVYRYADDSGGHTGFCMTSTPSNVYTREAHGSDYGVEMVVRSKASLTDMTARYYKRASWGASTGGVHYPVHANNVTANGTYVGDPNVHVKFTRDGKISSTQYWTGQGRDGTDWIKYDLGSVKSLAFVKLAWIQGNARIETYSIDVSRDNTTWTNVLNRVQSSGTTLQLETVDFPDVAARYVRITGYGNNLNDWNSLAEAQMWVDAAAKASIPAAQVTASAGTDPASPASYAVDGKLLPVNPGDPLQYWAALGNDGSQWIKFDLGSTKTVAFVKLAWHQGDLRKETFSLAVSTDNVTWTTVLDHVQSCGNSLEFETWEFANVSARYVRVTGYGNTVNAWNSLNEAQVWTTTP
ncbi:MAG: discoidin domain-containing protein [Opitutae bacterium]|nr:discoidin domain-containing protein [Opitutae bacterium]